MYRKYDMVILILILFIVIINLKKKLFFLNKKMSNEIIQNKGNTNINEQIIVENKTNDYTNNYDEKSNYDEKNNKKELIFFWANWCGHCRDKKPLWENLKKQISKKNLDLKEIDCSTNNSNCIMYKNNIKEPLIGVPTIILRSNDKDDVEYEQNLDLNSMNDFLYKNDVN